jgi:hypothetical protein
MGAMSRADGPLRYINFYWIPRARNSEANDLALMASGYKAAADRTDLQVHLLDQGDWRADIFNYLKDLVEWGTQEDTLQGYEIRPDRR